MNAQIGSVLDQLLRSPKGVAERAKAGEDLPALAIGSLIALVGGAGIYGAVLASSRGGLQLLYSGLKLPLALLATLVVVVPAFYAINKTLGRSLSLAGMVGLSLAAVARGALMLAALAPIAWLAIDRGIGYHASVLVAAGSYALAGLAALRVFLSGVGADLRGLLVILAFGAVVLPAGGQTAWMLRPFIGRPAQTHVPFFRARESSFLDAVTQSARSSVGIYGDAYDGRRMNEYGEVSP